MQDNTLLRRIKSLYRDMLERGMREAVGNGKCPAMHRGDMLKAEVQDNAFL
jgi:hypothetical protein